MSSEQEHGGKTLLDLHGGSVPQAVTAILDHHHHHAHTDQVVGVSVPGEQYHGVEQARHHDAGDAGDGGGQQMHGMNGWRPWLFAKTPARYWRDVHNQRLFLSYVGDQMGYTSMTDWHNIKGNDIVQHGGGGLLKQHGGSVVRLVQAVWPSHSWQWWRFRTLPQVIRAQGSSLHLGQHQRSSAHQGSSPQLGQLLRSYFEAVGPLIGLSGTRPSEWLHVSFRQLASAGPCWFIKRLGLYPALLQAYPELGTLHPELLPARTHVTQHSLACLLRNHLPGVEVLENSMHPSLSHKTTNAAMSIDIYVPQLQLGFEYHTIPIITKLRLVD